MNVGTLTIFLGVTTSGINKAIRDTNRLERNVASSAASINTALLSVGRVMTQFVTFPAAILGSISAKAFSDFEHDLAKVTGLVGIAERQTKEWGEEIKSLSSTMGKSATELSEALYFVTSAGIRGSETMDVLEISAKAAAAGLGETKDVADLITSAMNAYGKENLSAARAGDILVATVKEAKAEGVDLAKSMGIVLPIASKLGASFDQVGMAIAAMTRTGTKANTAAMQTRQILNKMVKPAKQSEKAIKSIGTSFGELRYIIETEGLLPALLRLNEATKEYGIEAVAKVFPRIRALAGVLDILGKNLHNNIEIQESITNSAGALNRAFEVVAGTFKFKVNQFVAEAKTLFIELGESIGDVLIPILRNLMDRIGSLTDSFNRLSDSQKTLVMQTVLWAALTGPIIILYRVISTSLVPALGLLYTGLGKSLKAILTIDIATKSYIATLKKATGATTLWGASLVKLKSIGKTMALIVGKFAMIAGFAAIIGILGTALVGWIRGTKKMYDAQEELNKALEEGNRAAMKEKDAYDKLVSTATNSAFSKEMQASALVRLNQLSPEYLRNLNEENARTEEGAKLIENYTRAIENQNKQKALYNRLSEVEAKRIKDVASERDRELTFWERARKGGVVYAATGTSHVIPYINKRRNAMKELQWQEEKAERTAQEYAETTDSLREAILNVSPTLKDYQVQYKYLAEQIENAKDADNTYVRQVLANAQAQERVITDHLSLIQELIDARIKADSFAFYFLGEGKELQKQKKAIEEQLELNKKQRESSKKILNANKERREYEETTAFELKELWTKYEEGLKTIERAHERLGGDYDVIGEKLELVNSILEETDKIEGALFVQWVQDLISVDSTLRLATDSMKDMADEREHLADTWEREMEAETQAEKQTKKINSLFMQGEALANTYGLSLKGLTNHFFDSAKSAKDFKKVLDELEKMQLRGLLSEEELKRLQDFFNIEPKWDVNNILKDMNVGLERAQLMASMIGEGFDSAKEKARVYSQTLSQLLRMNLEDLQKLGEEGWQKLISNIQTTSEETRKFQLEMNALNVYAQETTSLMFGLGEALVNAQNAFTIFGDHVINILEQVIGAALKAAIANNLASAPNLFVAAIAIGALKALWNKQKDSMDASVKMARGGVVPQGYPNDSYPARLTSGEMVVPPGELPNLDDSSIAGVLNSILSQIQSIRKIMESSSGFADKYSITGSSLGFFLRTYDLEMTKMANGGIVPQGYPNDSYPAMLSSGERVVPPKKLPELQGKEIYVMMPKGTWEVEGRKLKYIIDEENRRFKNVY